MTNKLDEQKALSIVLAIADDSMDCMEPSHLEYIAEEQGVSEGEIYEAFKILRQSLLCSECRP